MGQYAYAEGGAGAEFAVRKQQLIDTLTECYSRDVLTVEEYERRVEKAHAAKNAADLDAVAEGLPIAGRQDQSAARANHGEADPRYHAPREAQSGSLPTVFCLLGGQTMRGSRLSKGAQVFCMLGGATLDFRGTPLPPGETKVEVFAMMGGVEVFVPPGVAVHTNMIPILGGVDINKNVKQEPYPGEPYITISGVAVMGGVDVKARN